MMLPIWSLNLIFYEYYELNYVSSKTILKALAINLTVFGEKAMKEVIKVKWGLNGGVLIR